MKPPTQPVPPPDEHSATTRRRLLGTAAVTAAAALLLGALWGRQRHAQGAALAQLKGQNAPTPHAASPSGDALAAIDLSGLWRTAFPAPQGGELAMSHFQGHPLVLNFWASWCPPCVRELPLFEQFYAAHSAAGWRVVGLAVDTPEPVREFLSRHKVSFPIGLAGLGGTELMQVLGNQEGGLPYTIVIDSRGKIVEQILGASEKSDFERWLKTIK